MRIESATFQRLNYARLVWILTHAFYVPSKGALRRLLPVSLRMPALLFVLLVLGTMSAWATPAATSTSLSLSSTSVSAGTVVTLSASVSPSGRGSVKFCVASASYCTGVNLLKTVQVTTGGTATFRKIFGQGAYQIKAVFSGTNTLASSTSPSQPLIVSGSGSYGTSTTIAATGNPGNYTVSGRVAAFGIPLPTGTVSFLNTTAANAAVGSATVDPASLGFNFVPSSSTVAPESTVVEDFNNDGILDIASGNANIAVALGLGDGTFRPPVLATAQSGAHTIISVDLNGDGNMDLIATNNLNGTRNSGEVDVLLGNGDGTFQAPTIYTTQPNGGSADSIVAGDVNGDGIPDLVTVLNYDDRVTFTKNIRVMIGNGDGTFQASVPYACEFAHTLVLEDVNADGKLDVVLGGASNDISVMIGNGDGTFQNGVVSGAGSSPYGSQSEGMVAGDFNNDGKIDLAIAENGSGNIGVLLGQGDGTFPQYSAYPIANSIYYGPFPYAVSSGDFNGDGLQDLAVSTIQNVVGTVFLLGKGDGTFIRPGGLAGTATGRGVGVGDFNGDGLDDAAATDILLSQRTITATATGISVPGPGAQQVDASYPGDASHSASISTTTPLLPVPSVTTLAAAPSSASPGSPVSLSATVSPSPTTGTVSFYSGSALLSTVSVTGSVTSYVISNLPLGTSTLTATYSGGPLVGPSTSNNVRVFVGAQTATSLSASTSTAVLGTPIVLTATATSVSGGTPIRAGQVTFTYQETVNGVTFSGSFGSVSLSANGTAVLTTRPPAGTYVVTAALSGTATAGASTSTPQMLTIAGNGSYGSTTELVSSGSVGDYTLTATVSGFGFGAPAGTLSFLNTTNGNQPLATAVLDPTTVAQGLVPLSTAPPTASNVQFVATGDFNQDGMSDYATVTSDGKVVVDLTQANGLFQSGGSYTISTSLNGIVAADVNGDGKLDLVAISASDSTISILLGNGDGSFQSPQGALILTASAGPTYLAVADLNGDGKLDLVETASSARNVSVFLGNGDGTFGVQQDYRVGRGPNSVAIADFNADGNPDLAISNESYGNISILLGVGDGTFQAQTSISIPYGDSAGILAAGSLRGNGVADLIAPDLYDSSFFVYLGNNDGTFAAPVRYSVNGSSVGQAVLADVNHDGKLDLVATYNNQLALFSGIGDGTFASEQDFSTGNGLINVALADFNNDGLIDFITSDATDNTTTILLGQQSVTAIASAVYATGTGTQLVNASFPGDSTHAASLSNTVPLQPSVQSLSSTSLSASSVSITAGDSVTFTAAVLPVPTGNPFGTIRFYNGGALLGSVPVNANGVAAYTTAALPAGLGAITAVYSGNAVLATSTSNVLAETVTVNTITLLSSSTVASIYGQPVTLTANVTPVPTGSTFGTVAFYQGSTLLGTGTLTSSGSTGISASTLAVGTDAVTAIYSGNGSYLTSTSNIFSITVTATSSTLVTSAVPSTVSSGGNVGTLIATIKDASGNTVTTSSAPVTSTISGPNGYSQSVTSAAVNGIATLNLSPLTLSTAGLYTVTTSSPGLPSSIAPVTVTSRGATQIVVSAAPASVQRGGNVGVVTGTLKNANGTTVLTPSLSVTATITGPNSFSQAVTVPSANGLVTFNLSLLSLTDTGVYTLTVSGAGLTPSTQTITVAKTNTTITWAVPASIGFGTPLSSTQLNATGSVAGILTYSPASGTTLQAGTQTLSVTLTPTDSANYTTATSSVQILVRAASTTTLTAGKSTELATLPLTFTAQVKSSFVGTTTGSVSFFDGTALLGTIPVASGVAVYSTTSLGDGVHTITATYSGDTNYLSSTSSTSATITVADLNLDLGGDKNKSVTPGAAVAYSFPLSPLVTPTFLYDVQLTASGLPPGATYTFSPSTIPAGSGTTPTVLTVQTAKNSAALAHPSTHNLALAALGFGLFLPLLGRRRLQAIPHLLLITLFAFLSLGTMAGLSGCGNSGFFGATKTSGNYTITVIATSGGLVRTSTVQLTIQ